MKTKMNFKTYYLLEQLSYDDYVSYIEPTNEGIKDFASGVSAHLKNIVNAIKDEFYKFHDKLSISKDEMKSVFSEMVKSRTFFSFLKAFGFSVRKIIQTIEQATSMIVNDLLHIFKEISESKIVQKINSGLLTVDDLIEKYPILNRITGFAVIGILLVGWINMTFVGNAKYDFNWSNMIQAAKGNQSLADVLVSSNGLMFLSLVMLGVTTGIGFAWLGLTGNIILALVYTGYYYSRNKSNRILQKIKDKIS